MIIFTIGPIDILYKHCWSLITPSLTYSSPLGITFMEWNKMFKFTPESDKVSFVHFDLGEGK